MTVRCGGTFLALLFLAFFMAVPAHAEEKIKQLSEENITAFILETTEISAGRREGMGPQEVLAYLDRHIDKKGFFKSTMKFSMPGAPTQETTMSLDKEEFIQSVEKGSQTINSYETKINIKSIKISGDGRKATVQTEGREQAMMPLEVDGQLAEVPVEGFSKCLQILTLSDDDAIQMNNAVCTTDIVFSGFDQ